MFRHSLNPKAGAAQNKSEFVLNSVNQNCKINLDGNKTDADFKTTQANLGNKRGSVNKFQKFGKIDKLQSDNNVKYPRIRDNHPESFEKFSDLSMHVIPDHYISHNQGNSAGRHRSFQAPQITINNPRKSNLMNPKDYEEQLALNEQLEDNRDKESPRNDKSALMPKGNRGGRKSIKNNLSNMNYSQNNIDESQQLKPYSSQIPKKQNHRSLSVNLIKFNYDSGILNTQTPIEQNNISVLSNYQNSHLYYHINHVGGRGQNDLNEQSGMNLGGYNMDSMNTTLKYQNQFLADRTFDNQMSSIAGDNSTLPYNNKESLANTEGNWNWKKIDPDLVSPIDKNIGTNMYFHQDLYSNGMCHSRKKIHESKVQFDIKRKSKLMEKNEAYLIEKSMRDIKKITDVRLNLEKEFNQNPSKKNLYKTQIDHCLSDNEKIDYPVQKSLEKSNRVYNKKNVVINDSAIQTDFIEDSVEKVVNKDEKAYMIIKDARKQLRRVGSNYDSELHEIFSFLQKDVQDQLKLANLVDDLNLEDFLTKQRKAANKFQWVVLQTMEGFDKNGFSIKDLLRCDYRFVDVSNTKKTYDVFLNELRNSNTSPQVYSQISVLLKVVENYEDQFFKLKSNLGYLNGNNEDKSGRKSFGELDKGVQGLINSQNHTRRGSNIEKSPGHHTQRKSLSHNNYSGTCMGACLNTLKNQNQFYSPVTAKFNIEQLAHGNSILFDEFNKSKLVVKSQQKGEEKDTGAWLFDELEKTFKIYYEERETLRAVVNQKNKELEEKDKLLNKTLDKIQTFHTDLLIEANKELIDKRELFVEKECLKQEAIDDKDKELAKNNKYTNSLEKKVHQLRQSLKIVYKRNKKNDTKEYVDKETQIFFTSSLDFKKWKKDVDPFVSGTGLANLTPVPDGDTFMPKFVGDSIACMFWDYLGQLVSTNVFMNVLEQHQLSNNIFNYNGFEHLASNKSTAAKKPFLQGSNKRPSIQHISIAELGSNSKGTSKIEINQKIDSTKTPLNIESGTNIVRKDTNSRIEKRYIVMEEDGSRNIISKMFMWIYGNNLLGEQFLSEFQYFIKNEAKKGARWSLLQKIIIGREVTDNLTDLSRPQDNVSGQTSKIISNTLYSIDAPRIFLVILSASKDKLTHWKNRYQSLPSDCSKDVLINIDEMKDIIAEVVEHELGIQSSDLLIGIERLSNNISKYSKQAMLDNTDYLEPKRKGQEFTVQQEANQDNSKVNYSPDEKDRGKKKNPFKTLIKNNEDKVQFDILAEELLEFIIQIKVSGFDKLFTEFTLNLRSVKKLYQNVLKKSVGLFFQDPYYVLHSISKKPNRIIAALDPHQNFYSQEIMNKLKNIDQSNLPQMNDTYITIIRTLLEGLESCKVLLANERVMDLQKVDQVTGLIANIFQKKAGGPNLISNGPSNQNIDGNESTSRAHMNPSLNKKKSGNYHNSLTEGPAGPFCKQKSQFFNEFSLLSLLTVIQYVYERFHPRVSLIEELNMDKREGIVELKIFLQEHSPEKLEEEKFRMEFEGNWEPLFVKAFSLFKPLLDAIEILYDVQG